MILWPTLKLPLRYRYPGVVCKGASAGQPVFRVSCKPSSKATQSDHGGKYQPFVDVGDPPFHLKKGNPWGVLVVEPHWLVRVPNLAGVGGFDLPDRPSRPASRNKSTSVLVSLKREALT